MFRRNHDSVQQVKDQATTLAQSIIEQAANRAIYGADKAKGVASNARVCVPGMQKKGKEEVAPTIREVALQAAAAALDLWQTARERAGEAVETAEHKYGEPAVDAVGRARRHVKSTASHVVEDATDRAKHAASSVVERAEDASDRARSAATHVVEDATDRAKHAASNVVERAEDATDRAKHAASHVADRAEDATDRAKHAASHMADRAEEATDRVKEATRHAAGATVSTGKDTSAALFWTAAAAGIVFYALLDKDRRDQVVKVMGSFVNQARDMIRDFQGDDEEFV